MQTARIGGLIETYLPMPCCCGYGLSVRGGKIVFLSRRSRGGLIWHFSRLPDY